MCLEMRLFWWAAIALKTGSNFGRKRIDDGLKELTIGHSF